MGAQFGGVRGHAFRNPVNGAGRVSYCGAEVVVASSILAGNRSGDDGGAVFAAQGRTSLATTLFY